MKHAWKIAWLLIELAPGIVYGAEPARAAEPEPETVFEFRITGDVEILVNGRRVERIDITTVQHVQGTGAAAVGAEAEVDEGPPPDEGVEERRERSGTGLAVWWACVAAFPIGLFVLWRRSCGRP